MSLCSLEALMMGNILWSSKQNKMKVTFNTVYNFISIFLATKKEKYKVL